jgi:DNA-binding FadR family transcriptional regulator
MALGSSRRALAEGATERGAITGLRPIRQTRAADLIVSQLRRRIVREMKDGETLPPEAVLMETFNVARQTLRDALRTLEGEGLLTIRRGVHGGAIVHRPDASVTARSAALALESRGATLVDVYQARAMVEPPCAALLARHASPEDIAALREALAQTAEPSIAPVVAIRSHMAFHRLVAHLAGNQTVALLTDLIRHIIEAASEEQVIENPDSAQVARALRSGHLTHAKLIELIEAGDPEAARDLWTRHLEGSEDYLISGVGTKTVLDLLD